MRLVFALFLVFTFSLVALVPSVNAATFSACFLANTAGYYELTAHILTTNGSSCINITANSVVINLAGFSMWNSTGGTNASIYVTNATNVTIANGTLNSSRMGVSMTLSNNSLVTNVTIANLTGAGIGVQFNNVSNVTVSLINITNLSRGVDIVGGSSNNTFVDNNVTNILGDGLLFNNAPNNSISRNFVNNASSSGIYLSTAAYSRVFYNNVSNTGGGGTAVGIYCSSACSNSTFFTNIVYNSSGDGFQFATSINLNVTSNNVTQAGERGFVFGDTSTNWANISLNNATNTGWSAGGLASFAILSHNNNITYNRAVNSSGNGFSFDSSNNNTVMYNFAADHTRGSGSAGFSVAGSRNNLTFNNATNNIGGGIWLVSASLNNLTNNSYAISWDSDFYSASDGSNNRLVNENFSGVQITANFSGDVSINTTRSSEAPATPSGNGSLGRFVNVSNWSNAEVNLTIFYTDADLTSAGVTDESTVKIFRHNNATGNWIPLTTTVSAAGNNATATLTTFSVFGLFGTVPAASSPRSSSSGGSAAAPPGEPEEEDDQRAELTYYATLVEKNKIELKAKAGNALIQGVEVSLDPADQPSQPLGSFFASKMKGSTDSNGRVYLYLPGFGEYSVKLKKQGFRDKLSKLVLRPTLVYVPELEMQVDSTSDSVFDVSVTANGGGVNQAEVALSIENGREIDSGTTASNGEVSLAAPSPGTYILTATKQGTISKQVKVALRADGVIPLPSLSVSSNVTSPNNLQVIVNQKPLDKVVEGVVLTLSSGESSSNSYSNLFGQTGFVLSDFGNYTLTAEKTGFQSDEQRFSFEPAFSTSALNASLEFNCPGNLEVSVVSEEAAVQGSQVSAVHDLTQETLSNLTNAQGKVIFQLSRRGSYTINVEHEGRTITLPFSFLPENCPAPESKLELRGTIFCPNVFQVEALYWGNNPVAGATITAWRSEFGRVGAPLGSRQVLSAQTNENGLVNLTLQIPRIGIYEYSVRGTALGFQSADPIVVAYEAGRTNCLERRNETIEQLRQRARPGASQVIDVIDEALPFDLPRGPRADLVLFFVLLLILLVILTALYRLYQEIKLARRPTLPEEPGEPQYKLRGEQL